ncbi:hypothetical protein [Hypericibacter sp.]|uniref:hypothetical protein n=1 Tax=Hypericibacter sp. TaxID=2705401 RepID=UPI003D6D0C9D
MTDDSTSPAAAGRLTAGRDAGGRIILGTEAHKQLFCRMLLDSHDPYKPAVIDWPKLDEDAFARLTGLPIWDMAVRFEGQASMAVLTYAATIQDPLLREAVTMDGNEEARHKLVLSKMVEFYGIKLEAEPDYPPPADSERAFMQTGYGECLDSFFAFGLFELARRSGFFPLELVETFEPVIQEECRHILFFVNWRAWHRRQLPFNRRILFDLRCMRIFAGRIRARLATAKDVGGKENFTATSGKAIETDIKARDLMSMCLSENDRRMARYDSRLIRPKLVPTLVRIALKFMR